MLSVVIEPLPRVCFYFVYALQMQHVLADAILSFRLLKVGGLLIFDDMKTFPGVGRATTAVIEALEGENCVEVLHNEVCTKPVFHDVCSILSF